MCISKLVQLKFQLWQEMVYSSYQKQIVEEQWLREINEKKHQVILKWKNKMLQLDAQTYQILYPDIHISRLNLAYNKQAVICN